METETETIKEVIQEIRTAEERQKLTTVLCVVTHGSFPNSTAKFFLQEQWRLLRLFCLING